MSNEAFSQVPEVLIEVLVGFIKESLGHGLIDLLELSYLALQFCVLFSNRRCLEELKAAFNREIVPNVLAHGVNLLVAKKLSEIGVALETL